MKLNYLFYVTFLAIFCSQSFNVTNAQVTAKPLFNTPVPVSPQSASLIKSIEFPVDHARGLANISIPLYTIKVNDLEVPIVLKYHSSGIKVFDQSGWVGSGWSLIAEPTITRAINGRPDENHFLYNENLGSNEKEYLDGLVNNIYDELPDQFYYNLVDKSGSFLYSRKPNISGYNIKTLPFQPIKITSPGVSLNQLTNFKIVDDNGRQYFFGGNKLERTSLLQTTAWKGTKIVSANLLDTIYFDYHPKYDEFTVSPQSHKITVEDNSSSNYNEMTGSVQSCLYINTMLKPTDEQLAKPLISKYVNGQIKKYLYDNNLQQLYLYETVDDASYPEVYTTEVLYAKEIKFRGGKVIFEIAGRTQNYDIKENLRCLSRIIVYNDNNSIIKEIKFNYQEILSTGTLPFSPGSYYETRLQLANVQISGSGDPDPLKYEFSYNFTNLPNRFSYDMDEWGYYNGPKNNQSLIPVSTISTSITGGSNFDLQLGDADRSSDEHYMQAGILTEIKYPTGGTTTFTYEANKAYNSQTNTSKVVGGLRINKIADYNPVSGLTKQKYFTYGINEIGAGYLRHWTGNLIYNPYVIQQDKLTRLNLITNCVAVPGQPGYGVHWVSDYVSEITARYRTIMSQPVTSLFYNGEVVAYPEVTEYIGNPGNNIGKTVYSFQFSGMGSGGGYETPYFINGTTLPYDNKTEWAYGHVNEKNDFLNGSTYSKVAANTTNYQALYDTDKIWSRSAFKMRFAMGLEGGIPSLVNQQLFQTQVNEYETGYLQLLSDTTKTYLSSNSPIIQVNNYQYNNLHITSPTTISTITSEGKLQTKKISYPHEMVAMGHTEPYQEMVNQNMISLPIKTEEFVDTDFLASSLTNYSRFWPTNASLITPKSIKTKFRSEAEETKIEFLSYDKFGNILSYMPVDGIKTCYIWSYKNKHPIAEIKNIDYATIASVLGGDLAVNNFSLSTPTSDSQVNNFLAPLRASPLLKNAFITSYTYDPLIGMTSTTDAKGMTTYYEYDSFQRLKAIRDQNGDIVKSYCYNYAGQVTDCSGYSGGGGNGTQITYLNLTTPYYPGGPYAADITGLVVRNAGGAVLHSFDHAQLMAGVSVPYGTYNIEVTIAGSGWDPNTDLGWDSWYIFNSGGANGAMRTSASSYSITGFAFDTPTTTLNIDKYIF
ncbi:hypothetical protein FA048_19570 [Pedobacter polaris]|uniref:YD repeat-containing protein n=1 Tax=Pedobacter polaris TaxID=2571273 RepID=A0A4U1CCL4_9SPHI|nr:hypothetical protein [Pedobacter polaris]TKC04489.1 hypothetical protein FA048_19570 [Pedobacter polaris]